MNEYRPAVLSNEQWVADTHVPDVLALCDPFTGIPFRGINLDEDPSKNIPPTFQYDEELQPAYFNWQYMADNNVGVNVLLTDPSSKEGLGDLDYLASVMAEHDIIGYAVKRGALRTEMARRAGYDPLDEVINNDSYINTLKAVARSVGKNIVFNYDPKIDAAGRPDGTAAHNLQQVEDAVRLHLQENVVDLAHPDGASAAMNGVHGYMLGTVQAGQASLELDDLTGRVGMLPGSVLLIQPADVCRPAALIHHKYGIEGGVEYVGPERDAEAYEADRLMTTEAYIDAR